MKAPLQTKKELLQQLLLHLHKMIVFVHMYNKRLSPYIPSFCIWCYTLNSTMSASFYMPRQEPVQDLNHWFVFQLYRENGLKVHEAATRLGIFNVKWFLNTRIK